MAKVYDLAAERRQRVYAGGAQLANGDCAITMDDYLAALNAERARQAEERRQRAEQAQRERRATLRRMAWGVAAALAVALSFIGGWVLARVWP